MEQQLYQDQFSRTHDFPLETHVEKTQEELDAMGPLFNDAKDAAPVIGGGILALLLLL